MTDATGDLLSKTLAMFTRKHVLNSLLNKVANRKACNFIKKRPQHRCFPAYIGKFLKKLFWRTSAYACFWRVFWKWLIRTFFVEKRFQNHSDLVILRKTPVGFKPEPSLPVTPTLYFELRFHMFIINGCGKKANACRPWTFC